MSMTKKQTRGTSPVEGERPVHSPVNSTSMLPRARDVSANPATILLVEDEISLRGLMRRILERGGYRVLEAEHGAAALACFATYVDAIDLVVSDIVMPTMGGREMAERLRALRPNSRLLFVSGFTGDEAMRRGIDVTDSAYLQKPFSPASLVAKIGEMLRGPAIEAETERL
jgi:two-component system cell cycle sensor histidine kinase/response regulator CckA